MLHTHGTMVDVSAPFVMPMCDSDIPINAPFPSRNKQPFPHAKEANEKIRSLERASACEHTRLGVKLVLPTGDGRGMIDLNRKTTRRHNEQGAVSGTFRHGS